MYLDGEGVPKDHQKAMEYFQESANKGDSNAHALIGILICTNIVKQLTTSEQGLCIMKEMEYHEIIIRQWSIASKVLVKGVKLHKL